jgi:acetyl-CoA C-acetyltransferase
LISKLISGAEDGMTRGRKEQANIPVLIGCGQITDRRPAETVATPIELMVEALRRAAADAGPGQAVLQAADVLVAIGLTADSPEGKGLPSYANVPALVAAELGIEPATRLYTAAGGNTPQMLLNLYAERIASGECETLLLTGAEALAGMLGRLKQNLDLSGWQSDEGEPPEMVTSDRLAATPHEMNHGIQLPASVYPLFENALRGRYGEDIATHQRHMGELFSRFSRVASENPLAWFPVERSASELADVSETNRYVGFPYTKYLNAIIQVNMGAALIMTSVGRAREMGVAEDRLVYLHGCADANDRWYIHERENYYSSPAIRTIGRKALAMAGRSIDDMDYLDIYSCFPSAVQIACDELGIAHDDSRGLTVTGGLPYFGGPGNNYVTHSIATMMDRLRAKPGAFGLLNANGWFITKHSIGVYSTTPLARPWRREDPAAYRDEALTQPVPPFTETPQGTATIETYTVLYGRQGPERGLVIGRLADGTRFVANTPDDADTLQEMVSRDMLGAEGTVSSRDGRNIFSPAGQ